MSSASSWRPPNSGSSTIHSWKFLVLFATLQTIKSVTYRNGRFFAIEQQKAIAEFLGIDTVEKSQIWSVERKRSFRWWETQQKAVVRPRPVVFLVLWLSRGYCMISYCLFERLDKMPVTAGPAGILWNFWQHSLNINTHWWRGTTLYIISRLQHPPLASEVLPCTFHSYFFDFQLFFTFFSIFNWFSQDFSTPFFA